MQSVIGGNVVMWHITITLRIKKRYLKEAEEKRNNYTDG